MTRRMAISLVTLVACMACTAFAGTSHILGHIYYPNGDPTAGVLVTVTPVGGGAATTDTTSVDGAYNAFPLTPGTYTVVPSLAGCASFEPASRTVTVVADPDNSQWNDFVATCSPAKPTLISPPNGSTGISLTPTLSWSAPGATTVEVYLGPAGGTLTYVANSTTGTQLINGLTPNTSYQWQVQAFNSIGHIYSDTWTFTTGSGTVPPGYRYVPVQPCRVLDTRPEYGKSGEFGPPGLGVSGAPLTRDVTIPSGTCNIPPTAVAFALNVTVVPQGPLGFLTVWPTGQPQPLVSTLNSDGRIVANAAIVPANPASKISVYASNPTDLVLDINGYFDNQAGSSGFWFYPIDPCRVLDTRLIEGGVIAGGATLPVLMAGTCGLPVAPAYSLNATVQPQGPLGYLTLWPTGAAQPYVSTLNSTEGVVVANAAIIPADVAGWVNAFATNPTDLIVDTNGYFGAQTTAGMSFYPVTPCRILDTRDTGQTILSASEVRDVMMFGACSNAIPATAKAVSINVTVVPSEPLGYLTIWPSSVTQPYVSTLNSHDGRIVANAALVPVGTDGAVKVFVTNPTHVIIDINGYFAQ